jgi:hypothetical protein
MTTDLKNKVIEIAKNSSFHMRSKETGVTAEKVADCAVNAYNTIQGAIESGKLAGYGKSHDEDGKVSQVTVEGFDYYLNKLAGMHGVHYALKAEDKRQIVSAICEALGQPKYYPVYDGDNAHQAPASAVWADDDPRWATVGE